MVDGPLADARDMFAVHTVFRREYGLMPALVRGVADGDTARVALVADHVALLTMFLTVHHAAEDKHIWPRLRERGTSEIASLADAMEEQHEAIHAALEQVEEAVGMWRSKGAAGVREVVADAVEQLIAATDEHLALEELRIVPLIEKYITASEYTVLASEAAAHLPADLLPVLVGMFMYEAHPEVTGMVVEEMPPEIQPLIRDLATKAYAAYAEELYGTSTPPRVTR